MSRSLPHQPENPLRKKLELRRGCVYSVSPQHNPREHYHMTDSPIEEQASVGDCSVFLKHHQHGKPRPGQPWSSTECPRRRLRVQGNSQHHSTVETLNPQGFICHFTGGPAEQRARPVSCLLLTSRAFPFPEVYHPRGSIATKAAKYCGWGWQSNVLISKAHCWQQSCCQNSPLRARKY